MNRRLYAVCFCAFVFLVPLKFGNPIVLESLTSIPSGGWGWLLSMWPNQLAILGAFLLLAWGVWTPDGFARVSPRAVWIPCVFLATQLATMPSSVSPQVSLDTVVMFAAGLGVYALAMRQPQNPKHDHWPYTVLLGATVLICIVTIQQYFGGLQETRDFFHEHFRDQDVNSDYLIKLGGDRPFGTFVYPNSLGGYLVLVLPVLVARIWKLRDSWEPSAVWVVLTGLVGLVLFCLVLSGSKGGFLTLATVVVMATVLVRMPKRMKLILLLLLVVCAGALAVRYGPKIFSYGLSTSSARIDYWRAGVRIFAGHPWLGTGPGTFGTVYPQYKLYTSEDPRLTHNNFLEALSDSGIFGFAAYAGLWLVPLTVTIRRLRQSDDLMMIGLTLSLAAWVVHGLVDFDQYIPSLALLAFFFLGRLEGKLAGQAQGIVLPFTLRFGVTALALLLCVLPVTRLIGGYYSQQARLLTEANPFAATKSIRSAIRFAPLDPLYHSEASRIELKRGNVEEAVLSLARARFLDPYRSTFAWEAAMLIRGNRGLTADYFEAAEQAVKLAPKNPRYRETLAQDYGVMGLTVEAEEHANALREIDRHLHPTGPN